MGESRCVCRVYGADGAVHGTAPSAPYTRPIIIIIVVVIIIIIIIIIIISFMQGIYTYIPETNYVPRE